jgi:hypothetical protein
MKVEKILVSSLPAIFFFLGILSLVFSSLTISRIITLQYDAVDIFLRELIDNNILSAFTESFWYVWENVIWFVVLFLGLISCGLVAYTYFFKSLDIRIVIVSQTVFILFSFLLTDFSLAMLFISLSLFGGVLWMYKTFEERKNDFSTGYSVVSSRLGLLNILLCVGLFLAILMNLQTYENQIDDSNMNLISGLIPNATDIKNVQKAQIEQLSEGLKSNLDEQYQLLPSDVRTQCGPVYDAMIQGFDEYKNMTFEEIEREEIPIGGTEIVQVIPVFGLITKITPIFIVFSIYALLSVLDPLVGIFGGVVYSLMRKIKPK